MRFSIPVLAAFVLSSAAPLCAQTQAYEPDYETPAGRELVGVFISSHTFQGEHAEGLTEAVEELKLILSERAREEGVNFRMVAVIVDWETEVSLDYLADFGVSMNSWLAVTGSMLAHSTFFGRTRRRRPSFRRYRCSSAMWVSPERDASSLANRDFSSRCPACSKSSAG